MTTKNNANTHRTLLSKEGIVENTTLARKMLIDSDKVEFVVHFCSGAIMIILTENLPADPDGKETTIRNLGRELRAEHGSFDEALFLAESWATNDSNPDFMKIPPSEHPARFEAVVIVGRNADKSNSVLAVHRFSRNEANEPVWQEVEIHHGQGEEGISFEGILDYLFDDTVDLKSPKLKA